MNYREELQKALERAGGDPSASDGESLESYWNICCGCVLAAEQEIFLLERQLSWEPR